MTQNIIPTRLRSAHSSGCRNLFGFYTAQYKNHVLHVFFLKARTLVQLRAGSSHHYDVTPIQGMLKLRNFLNLFLYPLASFQMPTEHLIPRGQSDEKHFQ